MKENAFRKYLEKRKLSVVEVESSVDAVREFKNYLRKRKTTLKSARVKTLRDYIALLIEEEKNSKDRLAAIARYCYFARNNDLYIYFAGLLGASDVLPAIGERLETIAGKTAHRKVFHDLEMPPLGSPQDSYPKLTKMVLDRMEAELPARMCREILTWNYHNIPIAAFKDSKKRFEKAASIDEYLKGEHKRLVKELEDCMREGRLWYEQEITPEVVEFVRGNQEICTGVRQGDKVYLTKIPYAPKQFLKEKDPTMRKYYGCHCQLVRTALRDGKPKIPATFCYCSAGYEKLHFDAIFDQPVEVELLETPLKGDARCRFAIKIPKSKMK
ncbi:MAG: hypothetical protein OEV57_01455 [Dehalococcoidia bacterium]|nr:hypothetical protein [Dehalococcoidia bacterium]MDH4366793.1 hypothetical protein [Dehalococcoidia bacterium]